VSGSLGIVLGKYVRWLADHLASGLSARVDPDA
jgi:hypothetical protein